MGCTPGKTELQLLACQGVLSPQLVFIQGRLEPHILCVTTSVPLLNQGDKVPTYTHAPRTAHTHTSMGLTLAFWSLSSSSGFTH